MEVLIGSALVALAVSAATLHSQPHAVADPTRADYIEAVVVRQVPLSLDPLVHREDPAVREIGHLLYRSLLRLDGNAVPQPDLATVAPSADGLSYRFHLQPDARWSDGRPVTVGDVLATLAVVDTPGFLDRALASEWQGVVLTSADADVVLTLPAPRASFLAAVAGLPVLPASVVQGRSAADLAATAAIPAVTSGPYRVASAEGATLHLVPSAAAPAVHLRSLELRLVTSFSDAVALLQAHDVDLVAARTPAQRSALGHAGVHVADSLTFRYVDLIFNESVPGLDDPAVRRAIGMALDRAQLVSAALDGAGVPQTGPVPVGDAWLAHPAAAAKGDLAGAGVALDAAGWHLQPDGSRMRDGTRLAFTVSVPDIDPGPTVAGEVARQLEPLGVTVIPQRAPADRFEPDVLAARHFQLAIVDWDAGPDPDLSVWWRSNATPPQGMNVSGMVGDPYLDQALDELATSRDTAVRVRAAARITQLVTDAAPVVFLYAPTASLGYTDRLAGVSLLPTGGAEGRYSTIAQWRDAS